MANVHDVASYILKKHSPLTAMKLQKLVYYCQAWALVWDEKPLFRERIEAWANGPVVPELYEVHKGHFQVRSLPKGSTRNLTKDEKETIDAVIAVYGGKSSQWLSDLTHQEAPWKEARVGLSPGTRSNKEIKRSAMAEYYESLPSS
ncbi:MAG: DUF4065 domain-containing protein [Nitrospira sp.]|nr:DUF4065 domain-containing protein [Nitrospira sp.]